MVHQYIFQCRDAPDRGVGEILHNHTYLYVYREVVCDILIVGSSYWLYRTHSIDILTCTKNLIICVREALQDGDKFALTMIFILRRSISKPLRHIILVGKLITISTIL